MPQPGLDEDTVHDARDEMSLRPGWGSGDAVAPVHQHRQRMRDVGEAMHTIRGFGLALPAGQGVLLAVILAVFNTIVVLILRGLA